jgi:hypothetical protein
MTFLLAAMLSTTASVQAYDLNEKSRVQDNDKRLNARVKRFDTAGRSLISVVVDLAYEYRLPTGIEYVDQEAMSRPIHSVYRDESIGVILTKMVGQFPEYGISLTGGIVNLYSREARKESTNLLNTTLTVFSVNAVETRIADFELFCSLTEKIEPGTRCSGSLATGQWKTDVITLDLRDATVHEILNAIVAENGSAIWTVITPKDKLNQIPVGGLWHIYPLDEFFKQSVLEKLRSVSSTGSH